MNQEKVDREIKRFHSQKLIESFDALNFGRLRNKRRETIVRQDKLYDILVEFEGKSNERKVADLKYHLLSCGTVCSKHLDPTFFDCLPPLDPIEAETDITALPAFTECSFLDNTFSSIPDLETIPCPEITELPSFLGQNYESRDCTRVTRSKNKNSNLNPI